MQRETVLITGSARRLGRAIALDLAKHGYDIVVHYDRSADDAASLCVELRELGRSAWLVQADLSEAESCKQIAETCRADVGPVHHLVNSASIFPEDTLNDLTRESLDSNLAINTMAPFTLSKLLHESGNLKTVTNLLDTRVVDYDKNHVSYHLSKRALMSLTAMMALEWAPNLRVNAVAPGLILPPEGKDREFLEALAHTNPLQTVGAEIDITSAVRFLIASTFITGQIIYVDGGRHLKGRVYE